MLAPDRFMLWSMKIFPVRSAIFHAIVTRSGSALLDHAARRADERAHRCRSV